MQSSSSSHSTNPKEVIVCGAGVIGACTAYFLAQKGAHVTVVEKSAPACAASGKAGGFLALDWCDSSPLSALARRSFNLHAHLAELLSGTTAYAYRRLETLSLTIQEEKLKKSPPKLGLKLPEWVDGPATRAALIGTSQTTAQLHPYLFTRTILNTAVEKYGVTVVKGEVKEVRLNNDNVVSGVVVDDGEVLCGECVVLALGPWSAKSTIISRLCRISGLKVHSIVLRPKEPEAIGPQALSLTYKTAEGKSMDPEVYPRPTDSRPSAMGLHFMDTLSELLFFQVDCELSGRSMMEQLPSYDGRIGQPLCQIVVLAWKIVVAALGPIDCLVEWTTLKYFSHSVI